MAAAYAALVSLLNTIILEQRPRYHPHHRISINDGGLVEALQERVNSFLEFLHAGWNLGAEHLEDRMADAAHAAEDAIESYVVDQVLPTGDTSPGDSGSAQLCQDLEKIIEEMDSIQNEVKLIFEQSHGIKEEQGGSSTYAAVSSTCASPHGQNSKMVGFEDERKAVVDELTRGSSIRTAISIVGMGGSGKTTLARNIYDDHEIIQHFDFRAWITVSQEYSVNEIFIRVLKGQGDNEELLRNENDETWGDQVHKKLIGRRYLIVLDDAWTIDAWNKIERFFPNDDNGSRIMVTTRDLFIATKMNTFCVMMNRLDEDESWNLLCEKVFGPNSTCPLNLEDVGKEISQNCRGLPLSIVVIGGLLAKSRDRIQWEHTAELSTCAIHSDEKQHCSNILSLSYNHLSIFLKPCFLYMGVFPEDHVISVSELINLWIAEGFLKPESGKSVEEIGEEYLIHLIGRNLLTIHWFGYRWKIEYCIIHDLLRELCRSEAQKEKFLYVVMPRTLHDDPRPNMDRARRIAILLNESTVEEYPHHVILPLLSTSRLRSLIVNNHEELLRVLESPVCKLLRVLYVIGVYRTQDARDSGCLSKVLLNLVNLRHLLCIANSKHFDTLASFIGLWGNLQTLVVRNFNCSEKVPYEIWNLPQLRHVEFDIMSLLEPPFGEQEQHNFVVLKNLRTMKRLLNFRFDEGMLEKISNVKELDIWYTAFYFWEHKEWSDYCFHNLDRLEKLESLNCTFYPRVSDCNNLLQVFPRSLKELSLSGCSLLWENMTLIGSLPLLEVLELRNDSFIGPEWYLEEGEFLCLKFLYMRCLNLKHWIVDRTHLPCLERLVLYDLPELEEIPSEIGEVATLQLIELDYCSDSLVSSAKSILEEQQDLGNDSLRVTVTLGMQNELSCEDMENGSMLIDSSHPNLYMAEALERGAIIMGLDLGDIEDDPDGLEEAAASMMGLNLGGNEDDRDGLEEAAASMMGLNLGDLIEDDPDGLVKAASMMGLNLGDLIEDDPDGLVKAARRLGLVPRGDNLEDGPDELTVQESNIAESSASKQDSDPPEDHDGRHAFLRDLYMVMHIVTEFRWQVSMIAQTRE